MISWCSSCNEFISESEPFQIYEIKYELCATCSQRNLTSSGDSDAKADNLKAIKKMLWDAGSNQSLTDAEDAIERAIRHHIRPIDLLMGLVTPILWEIGDLWSKGTITHEDENRFTIFYTSVIHHIEKYDAIKNILRLSGPIDILLLTSPNNMHVLGVAVLNLWLHSNHVNSYTLEHPASFDSIIHHIDRLKPKFLGFSVALAGQLPGAIDLYQNIRLHLGKRCPPLLIGGNFIKESSWLPTAKNVTFIHDNSQLLRLFGFT